MILLNIPPIELNSNIREVKGMLPAKYFLLKQEERPPEE